MTETKTTLNTHCLNCEGYAAASAAVAKSVGVVRVEVDVPGKTVTVTHTGGVDRADVARALTRTGFQSE